MTVKVNYRVTPEITIQIDAVNVMAAIEAISDYQVMAPRPCGSCRSTNTGPYHKNAKGYDFYALRCFDCGAELAMGQFRDREALFLKEQDGWRKWGEGDHQ